MRILLLQPEDSPRRGAWTTESWDLAIDLGRSSPPTAAAWSELLRCPLLRAESFSKGIADIRRAGKILAFGEGRLLDSEGIDWWSLRSIEILREAAVILSFQTLAEEIPRGAELWSTRPGTPAASFARILGSSLRAYGQSSVARGAARVRHYARLPRHFSPAQLKEICLDKYDPAYRWRARFADRVQPASQPVILIPSAYTNVSRVASAYVRLLPDQPFLLVSTRRSATLFDPPPNIQLRPLGAYAETGSPGPELDEILEKWGKLSADLQSDPHLKMLQQLGMFDSFPAAFAQGLAVRNAWRCVLQREPVCGVLCGDDTNVNTRLPVSLAARRGLPTLDFHHGAMDGYYLVKRPPCDLYLAKTELERDYLLRVCGIPTDKVVVGAPIPARDVSSRSRNATTDEPSRKTSIVFFSEPYENIGLRAEEVYRELLPALCQLARETGRGVVLKLHPFESESARSEIVRSVLTPPDRKMLTVVSGPLSDDLLSRTWAGITVESTTVLDCALRGIPCFLCEWLAFLPFGYLHQYARFGAGQLLHRVEDVAEIPRKLVSPFLDDKKAVEAQEFRWQGIDPRMLSRWLGAEPATAEARPA
ncbi:MAG: hypothetical protein ACLQLC_12075 [Candidatus Sulfotelmatobacter sp.]